jgi:hypothetical protein
VLAPDLGQTLGFVLFDGLFAAARTVRDMGQTVRDAAAGASLLCVEPDGRRVRSAAAVINSTWILLPGGIPSGRRDPRVCLVVGRSSKRPPDDVDSKRDENRDARRLCYCYF